MPATRKRKPELEKSLSELERIVTRLESGELSIDESLKEFERGIRLSRECQSAIEAAEQRVKVLSGPELEEFEDLDEDPAEDADEAD